ncbi:hypothetical protein ACFSE1_15425 [Rhizobium helianthi]|uniref:DUF4430 domain-containing protein n=1 Tax=Rhizobium helianthi TaxID=1132695 RepID=A0ABW4M828_9HYPH
MNKTLSILLGAAVLSITLPMAASGATLSYKNGSSSIRFNIGWTKGMTVQQAMQKAGPDYVTGWSHKYSGNSLLMVLGTGNFPTTPSSTNGKLGSPYWLLCIDGKPASAGMTQQKIPSPKSNVSWIWTSKFQCN